MFKCNFCLLTYANKSKRCRHDRDIELVENNLDVDWCNECSFTARMLSNSQNYTLHNHGQLGGVCDYCHLGFQPPKNFSTHLLTTHGLLVMKAASADLATTSGAADAGLGNVRAADVAEINSTSLQKKLVCFFLVFWDIRDWRNQPMNEY